MVYFVSFYSISFFSLQYESTKAYLYSTKLFSGRALKIAGEGKSMEMWKTKKWNLEKYDKISLTMIIKFT